MTAKITNLSMETERLDLLEEELTKVGVKKIEIFNLLGVGVIRCSWGEGQVPTYILPSNSNKVTLMIGNSAGLGSNCYRGGVKSIPGMSHFYEHCMFHCVNYQGEKMNKQEIFQFANEHNIDVNAGTFTLGITTKVGFTPEAAKNITFDGYFKNAYKFLQPNRKGDTEDEAIDLLNSITFKHEIVEEDMLAEKDVVCSEINMYYGDQEMIQSRIARRHVTESYDELGTVDDIRSIEMKDMEKFHKIFTSGKAIKTMYISLDFFKYDAKYVAKLANKFRNKIMETLGTKELKQTNSFNHKYIVQKPTQQVPKTVKYSKLESTAEPMVVIEVPRDQTHIDNAANRQMISFVQYVLFAGLNRPITKMLREKFGRTYTVRPLNSSMPRIGKYSETEAFGWVSWLNHRPDEVAESGNGHDILTAEAYNNMVKEIEETMNSLLDISKDDFVIYKTSYADTLIGLIQNVDAIGIGKPMEHELGLLDLGKLSEIYTTHIRNISYPSFMRNVKYVVNNWRATIYGDFKF